MNRTQTVLARTFLLAASAVFSIAVATAPASAATTVGIPLAGATPTYSQTGTTIAQRRVFDDVGATYNGFSVGGVLTSVSVRTQQGAGVVDVSILRKTDDPSDSTSTFLSVANFG
ncbi:MAG: hypothetical protein ACRDKE_05050, partial [Solirubrobacterales bacterium]